MSTQHDTRDSSDDSGEVATGREDSVIILDANIYV